MNNKKKVYKIVLSVFVILALGCNTLPFLTASAFGFSVNINVLGLFNMEEIEALLGYVGESTAAFTVIKTVIVIIAILNIVAGITVWIDKKRLVYWFGFVSGLLQAIMWGLFAVFILLNPDM